MAKALKIFFCISCPRPKCRGNCHVLQDVERIDNYSLRGFNPFNNAVNLNNRMNHKLNKGDIMKTISRVFLVVVAILAVSLAYARQETTLKKKDVPKAVLDAFAKSYPKATVKGYSKETEDGKVVYEVASSEGKVSRDITFNADGTTVTTEETLAFKDLPEAVRASFTKEYPKVKAAKWEKVTEGSVTKYEAQVTIGKKSSEVVYNPDGTAAK